MDEVFVDLYKSMRNFLLKKQMRKCEPFDLKAITAAVTPGVAIDFFFHPLLSLTHFLSFIVSLFPTHCPLVYRSETPGTPSTWVAELQHHN